MPPRPELCAWSHPRWTTALDRSVFYHAGNTSTFDAFRGTLLADPPVSLGFPFRLAPADGAQHVLPVHQTCRLDDWYFERVGPFTSRGGYDWWSLYWNDYGIDLTPRPRGITGHVSTVVDASGAAIGLPPIHVHHMHLSPSLGLHNRVEKVARCMATGLDCLDASMLIQHHGDAQCIGRNGSDCLWDEYGRDHVKRITGPLSVFGHFNDVRRPGARPLEWYYMLGVRLWRRENHEVANDSVTFVSEHAFGQPGAFIPWKLQSYVVTLPMTRGGGHAYIETMRLPTDGVLWRMQFHAHQGVFRGADLYVGLPNEIAPHWTWDETHYGEETWRDVESVRAALRANAPQDAWLCSAEHASEKVADVDYDRKPTVRCRAGGWQFRRHDALTSVSFHASNDPAAFEGMKEVHAHQSLFPQHVSWFLEYAANDGDSHYTYSWASVTTPDAMDPLGTVKDTVRLFLHGGTPAHPPGVVDEWLYAFGLYAWALLYIIAEPWTPVATTCCVMLVALTRPSMRAIVTVVFVAQGVAIALLYVRSGCVYAFNERDATWASTHQPCATSWSVGVAGSILAVHLVFALVMRPRPPPSRPLL